MIASTRTTDEPIDGGQMIESEIKKSVRSAEAHHSVSTVKSLGEKIEEIRHREVQRAIRVLGWPSGSDAGSVIQAMSQSIVENLIADPISFARRNPENAQTISRVFRVDGD